LWIKCYDWDRCFVGINDDDDDDDDDNGNGTSALARVTCGGGASAREPPVDDRVSLLYI